MIVITSYSIHYTKLYDLGLEHNLIHSFLRGRPPGASAARAAITAAAAAKVAPRLRTERSGPADYLADSPVAYADGVALVEVQVALEGVGRVDPADDVQEDGAALARHLEVDDLGVLDAEALSYNFV